MDPLKAAVLGIVQGLTEFLPVSSSGHLVIGKALFGIQEGGIAFEVFVHFGTLLAVVFVFWSDIWKILRAVNLLMNPSTYQAGLKTTYDANPAFRWIWYILVASIPAVFVGLLFEAKIESAFSNPHLVSIMLIVTGVILLVTIYCQPSDRPIGLGQSIVVGLSQAFAILPGISRSGSTISTALYLNVEREEAVRFSFLLAIPVIAGATLLKTLDLLSSGFDSNFIFSLVIGTVMAFLSGYIAIKLLLKVVKRGKFYWFAIYCFVVGIIGLIVT